MRIRTARRQDLAAIFQIECQVFAPDTYPSFFFHQAHELWPDGLLVAEDEPGGLSGYLLAATGQQTGICWLLSLAVPERARGLGIGQALLEHWLERLSGQGLQRLLLTVHPDNPATRLYQRHGFIVSERIEDYFGSGEPRLLMEKIL